MTDEEVAQIQQTLGATLPDWYVQQLRTYPLPEPDESLFDSAERIIRENQELRRDGWFDMPWPTGFFVIGTTGAGDPFFILPERPDRRVFWADHEGGAAPAWENLPEMVFSETIAEYLEECRRTIADVNAIVERRKNKKWWQFWI